MRRLLGLVAAVALVAVGVVAGVGLAERVDTGRQSRNEVAEKPELGTATVVRTDLVTRKSFDASLAYVGERTVIGQLAGTVTAVPDLGAILQPGDAAVEIDGYPLVVMEGTRPMWRPLREGMDPGPDVLQLESALARLGFLTGEGDETIDPDDEFDADTAAAVERWREHAGLPDGDTIELGRLLFFDGPVRVGGVLVILGDLVGPGRPLLDVSGVDQAVFLNLPVDDRDLASVGDPVVVTLPGAVETTGVIQDIARVVTTVPGLGESEEVVEVTIELDDPGLAGDLDRAPVAVDLVSERAEDVLAVPVNALVALAEGGYAVQVADGGQRRLVPVEIGTFVDTLVEVNGPISEGDQVVVPK